MTDREPDVSAILKKYLSTPSEEDLKLTHDSVLQRLGDAIRLDGRQERQFLQSAGIERKRALADFEQRVLAATLQLQGEGEATGIAAKVRESLAEPSGTAAVFFTLNRLEGEGFISSSRESSKRFFKFTGEGERALALARAEGAAAREGAGLLVDFA